MLVTLNTTNFELLVKYLRLSTKTDTIRTYTIVSFLFITIILRATIFDEVAMVTPVIKFVVFVFSS